MEQHALSKAFPPLPRHLFEELKDDIRKNGVINPAVVFDGKIIDGWHRYSACNELGIVCPTVEYSGDSPSDFVISANIRRRHLTASQAAMAAALVLGDHSASEVSEKLGVSKRSLERAKRVAKSGRDDLVESVSRGDLSLRAAEVEVSPEVEELKDTIRQLSKENDELSLKTQQTDEELVQKVIRLEAELSAVKAVRDALQAENARLKSRIAKLQSQIPETRHDDIF